jgi:fatty acid desaturase
MSERRRNEKEEEKRHEKEDEKRQEKQFDEKFRKDPVRGISLAIILIWGGIVALIGTIITESSWWKGWSIFLVGTGIILLLKALIRLRPEYRRPIGGTVIIGLVLLGVGLGDLVGWTYMWPVILIVIGAVLVGWVFLRRR